MALSRLKKVTVASFVMLASTTSNATLMNADYLSSGDGLAVHDDLTGKTWLDLTVTLNTAYNDVDIDGYRYATNAEVVNLFETYWSSYTYNTNGRSDTTGMDAHQGAEAWHDLWGGFIYQSIDYEGYSFYQEATAGLYNDEDDILRIAGVYGIDYTDLDPLDSSNYENRDKLEVYGADFASNFDRSRTTGRDRFGTYLVKVESVPEPSSIALLALGLAGLGYNRRKAS